MSDPEIIIYTDGSSRGNPGPGGYGIIMKDCKSGFIKEYSKGFKLTTNNRMELMAVIDALKKVKKEGLYILIQNMWSIRLKNNGFKIGKKQVLKTKKM